MSLFDHAYLMAANKIKNTKTWLAFDATRRRTVRKVLLKAITDARRTAEGRAEAGDRLLAGSPLPPSDEAITDRHLEAVAEAGLPVIELLKMFGISSLMTIAKAIEGDDSA